MGWPALGRAAMPYLSRAAFTSIKAGRNYVAKEAPRVPFKEAIKGGMRMGWEIHKDSFLATGKSTILGRHSAMVAPYLFERRYP